MTSELAVREEGAGILERVIALGDLSKLTPDERIGYYRAVCESVGLNPLTRPLDYITLNGKLTLYANKGATDQIRRNRGVSIDRVEKEVIEGIYVVTVYGHDATGRVDSDMGTVPIRGLSGDSLANAMLKSLTKAKRRLTLSLCGLGMLDELEVETISSAVPSYVDADTGEIRKGLPAPPERPLEPPSIDDADMTALLFDSPVEPVPGQVPLPGYADLGTDPEPLTKDQIRMLLAAANITQAEAMTKAGELFPEWNPRKDMTDRQRGLLWEALG
jgi:hypothetical protein